MIKLYSTKTCAYCPMVEKYLTSKGVAYEKIMIDNDIETQKMLHKLTNATTVPITVNGDKFVVGWNVAKLKDLIS